MKLRGKIAVATGSKIASLARAVGTNSIDSVCAMWFHQPKVPESMYALKRPLKRKKGLS